MTLPRQTRRFSAVTLLLPVLAWHAPAARAEDSPGSRLNANARYPDVYLNDSFEANDALRRAKRAETSKRWEEAARAYRQTAVEYGDYLVLFGDDYYVNAAEYINQQLASWPPEGLDAYRMLFEQQAEKQLEGAAGRRDLRELLSLVDAYFCTDAAAKAADLAAQVAMENGDFPVAIEVYERLLAAHPRSRSLADPMAARLAVAYVWTGEKDKARKVLDSLVQTRPDASISWFGRTISPSELLQLPPIQPTTSPAAEAFTWPTFAGNASRNLQPVSTVQPGAPLWRFDAFQPGPLSGREGRTDAAFRNARVRGKFVVFQPAYGEGLVYFHDAQRVWALNAVSGTLAWTYGLPNAPAKPAGGDHELAPPDLFTCSLEGRRLFVRTGPHVLSLYQTQFGRPPTLMICLDGVTGELLWQLDRKALEEKLQDVELDDSPLAHNGKLYAVARRTRTFGFQDCYLLQIDARTGRPEWYTHLASASVGGQGYPGPTLTYPAIDEDLVFVHTNLGAIAAVSTHNGRVRWLRLYPRTDRSAGRMFSGRGLKPSFPWQYNPTLSSQAGLVVAPMDSDRVLVLRRSDGKIMQQIERETLHDVACVLGVIGNTLYGVGSDVFAWDLEANQAVWSKPLDPYRLYGRPFLARDRIYISTVENDSPESSDGALLTYDLTGRLIHDKSWNAATEGGNILATSDQIIIAGEQHVSAYAPKEEVFARLQRRIDADATDPGPLLDLAEIAFRIQDTARAVEALDQAADRVGGIVQLSEPKVKRRFYRDVISFGDSLLRASPPRNEEAIALYLRAAQCPPDIDAHVEYRMKLADALQRSRRHVEAVACYQQILLDPSLRNHSSQANSDTATAGQTAESLIRELIKVHGRDVYQRFDSQARTAHLLARDRKDIQALGDVSESFPNATAAPAALIDQADLLRQNGNARPAARVYYQALTRYPDLVDPADLIRRIAESYHEAGRNQSAAAWLAKGQRDYPSARIQVGDRRLSFAEFRARLLGDGPVAGPVIPKMKPVEGSPSYTRQFDATVQILQPRFQANRADLLFTFSDRKIEAFAVRDNRPLWPAPISCQMTPMFLGFDSALAVFATKHQIMAVDVDGGRVVWTHGKYPAELDNPDTDHEWFASWTTHVLLSGRLVSIEDAGRIFCLHTGDGRVLWQVRPELKPAEPILVSEEFIIYRAVRQSATVLSVLDIDSGKTLRTLTPRKEEDASTLFLELSPENVLLMATTKDIFAFDPYTGRPGWSVRVEGTNREASFQCGLDGFVLSESGTTLSKRSAVDGHKIWESSPVLHQAGAMTTLLHDDELYALSTGDVVSLDPNTGQERWVGVHEEDVHFTWRFLADPYFVAVDERRSSDPNTLEKTLTAYFYDRTGHSGQLPDDGRQILGRFSRLKGVYCYDNALIVLDGQTIHAFSPKNQ